MTPFFREALPIAIALSWGVPGMAAPYSVFEGSITKHGHKYCWYDGGWNGAGWYRCGFENKDGKGWGGPTGWEGAARMPPSSGGAWFELPPPAPPVSAPSIASERYVEPLRGGGIARGRIIEAVR